MVDLVGNIVFAIVFGWTVAATATDYILRQSWPEEGGNMRNTAHAERRFWGVDDPDIHNDFRHGLGIVLSMDSKTLERASRQAGSKARSLVCPVPRNSHEGPIGWLLSRLSISQRCDALEARMDGMAEWLESRSV